MKITRVRCQSYEAAPDEPGVPRRLSGVCAPHQRRLSTAIKQARNIALLSFASR